MDRPAQRQPHVVVLGGGSWGTTIASICARRGPTAKDINENHRNSRYLGKVLAELASQLRPWVPVVSLVKGLEQGTNKRMSQIVDEILPGHPAGILAGPNIAREVAEGYAAAAVLAMPDQHLAANLAELFRTRRFRTYTTDDVVGVEMAGALKNVYAIAVGMGYSLGIGENTRAMVMTRAVREMSKMGEAAGGHRDTFAGLA